VRDDLDIATSGTRNVRLLIMQAKSSLTETGFNAEDVEKFTRFTDDLLSLSSIVICPQVSAAPIDDHA
jgi:hypothetical protein